MGLVPPRAAVLRFAGHDIRALPTYRIARLGLGYVPEERRIFTDLTVYENLEVGAKAAVAGASRQPWTAERLFAIFPNLAEMRGRRASQMSGGEQQMLTIARTLMGNPEAVLLDEPSEGLAPVIVEQMAAAVLRMKAEGIAVLLSEQNLHFAAAVADRTYIIEKGAIRQEGRMAGATRGLPDGLKAPRTSGPVRPMRCPCAPALRPPDGSSPPASPRCRPGAGRGG
jgi:branched-chain amino acid transport system ATP-binding protein